jgi:NAD(P)-dependent dehydrogenase (short-subunit alcohol dehydrogenase family)
MLLNCGCIDCRLSSGDNHHAQSNRGCPFGGPKQVSNGARWFASAIPLGRFGRPDEAAKAVVFLACDDSSYITGAEVFVDGRFCAGLNGD